MGYTPLSSWFLTISGFANFQWRWGWKTVSFLFSLYLFSLSLALLSFTFNLLTNTLCDNRITDGVLFTLLTSEEENNNDNLDDVQPKNSSEISFIDKILGLPRSLFGK